jgi:DNA-binding SARP family transcriptional activator
LFVEFHILGPLEVAADGTPIELGPAKERALLGVLLLRANTVVSNDELVEEIWGDRPPQSAAKLVQVHVSRLRKALAAANGELALRTKAPGYALMVKPEQLDAKQFTVLLGAARALVEAGQPGRAADAYAEALGLWRGPVLADLALEGDARVEAGRLEALRLAAAGERIDCELACRRHAQVIPELEALTAQHPLDERWWSRLMLALYRAGRQSEALNAYQQARKRLVDQLGLEPGAELEQLEKAILNHDPALDLEAGRPQPIREPSASARAGKLTRRRFAGAGVAVAVAVAVAAYTVPRASEPAAVSAIESDSIALVDPAKNRLVDAVPLRTKPAAIGYGAGGLWVVTERDGTLLRIDPRAREVTKTIGLGKPAIALAISGRNVWVLAERGKTLFQFNGDTGDRIRTLALGGTIHAGPYRGQPLAPLESTIAYPSALAAGAGAAWVGFGSGVVLRVDAQTGAVEQVPAGSARGVAFGAGAIWSLSSHSRSVSGVGVRDLPDAVWRIAPDTRSVTKVLSASDVIEGGIGDALTVGAGGVWAVNANYRNVLKIDTRTYRVDAVRHLRQRHRPIGMAIGAGGVWAATDDATILRIDPETAAVMRTIPLGRSPRTVLPLGMATGAGILWVAVH